MLWIQFSHCSVKFTSILNVFSFSFPSFMNSRIHFSYVTSIWCIFHVQPFFLTNYKCINYNDSKSWFCSVVYFTCVFLSLQYIHWGVFTHYLLWYFLHRFIIFEKVYSLGSLLFGFKDSWGDKVKPPTMVNFGYGEYLPLENLQL
jgi:hypothetical protein